MKKSILYIIVGLGMLVLPGCFGTYGVVRPHSVIYTTHVHTPRTHTHRHHRHHYHSHKYHRHHRHYVKKPKVVVKRYYNNGKLKRRVIRRNY